MQGNDLPIGPNPIELKGECLYTSIFVCVNGSNNLYYCCMFPLYLLVIVLLDLPLDCFPPKTDDFGTSVYLKYPQLQ